MRFFTLTQAEPSHIINLRGLAIPNSIELGLTSNSVFGGATVGIKRVYNADNTDVPGGNPSCVIVHSFSNPTAAVLTSAVGGLTLDKLWGDGWLEFYIASGESGSTDINIAVGLPNE